MPNVTIHNVSAGDFTAQDKASAFSVHVPAGVTKTIAMDDDVLRGIEAQLNAEQTLGVITWSSAESTSDPADFGTPAGSAGGDLTGTYPNPTVGSGKITNAKMAAGAAAANIGSGGVTSAMLAAGAAATNVGANGVTGSLLSAASMHFLAFAGSNGAGPCAVAGTKVGDTVVGVVDLAAGGASAKASFENTITVVDQIQQTDAADLSAVKYALLVVAKS